MKQYIFYTNCSGYTSSIWKSWYIPFPEDLNPIFAKSNENVNKIFDSKTEKWGLTTIIKSNKRNNMKVSSKNKKNK